LFSEKCPGLTTWYQPQKAVYLQENCSGDMVQVGIFDKTIPGPGNQMVPMYDGFYSFGVSVLLRCMNSCNPWITIDEIGYLEAGCKLYCDTLFKLLEKKQVAMVVRKQRLEFLQSLCMREDVFVVDLDAPFGNIGCVIMASGLGTRFGGNKLMADFHGKPMICHILDATEEIFSQRIVVTRSHEITQFCNARNVRTVLHTLPHRSDTVRLGLNALDGVDRCMFCTGDQPLLRWNTVAALAIASANIPTAIWRPTYRDIPGSPVVFPRWSFPELLNLPEGKGGGVIIKKHPEQLRTVSVRDMHELKDVDTPEDLAELLGMPQ